MSDQPVNRVSVTDVDMPFLSMVRFMVKWAVAAIPALLLLMILGTFFWAVLLGFVAGVGPSFSPKPHGNSNSSSAPSLPGNDSSMSSSGSAVDPAIATYLTKIAVSNVRVANSELGRIGVFGEIKNTGDRTLKEVNITVYCLGPEGKAIFEKQFYPVLVSDLGSRNDNQPLKPGYSRQFGYSLDDAPSEWSKKVDVKVTSLEFQ
jgi:hypothetical protein